MKPTTRALSSAALLPLLACSLLSCRTVSKTPEEVITYQTLQEITDEVAQAYLRQVPVIESGSIDDKIKFAVLDSRSDLMNTAKILANFERAVHSVFTTHPRVDWVPRQFVQEGLRAGNAEERFPYAVNPKNPDHFLTPAVRAAFAEVMSDMAHPVTHVAWLELSSHNDELLLHMRVMDIRQGSVGQPVLAHRDVPGLAKTQI